MLRIRHCLVAFPPRVNLLEASSFTIIASYRAPSAASMSKISDHAVKKRKQSFGNGVEQPRYQSQAPPASRATLAPTPRHAFAQQRPFDFHNTNSANRHMQGFPPDAVIPQQVQGPPSNSSGVWQTAFGTSDSTFHTSSQYQPTRARPSSQTSNHPTDNHTQPFLQASGYLPAFNDSSGGGDGQHVFLPEVRTSGPTSSNKSRPTTDAGKAQQWSSVAPPRSGDPPRLSRTAPTVSNDQSQPHTLKSELLKAPAANDPLIAHMRKHLKDVTESQRATQATVDRLVESYESLLQSYESTMQGQADLSGVCHQTLDLRDHWDQELGQLRELIGK